MMAFVLGAGTVHCGTTTFAAASDAGSDGSGTTKSDGSGSGPAKDAGATQDAGSANDSGGSPDAGPPECTLSADCSEKAAPNCCYSIDSKTASCAKNPCPDGTYKTCAVPGDCLLNVGGGYCCVASASSKDGLCEPAEACASDGADIRCTINQDCPAGAQCSGGICVKAPDSGKAPDAAPPKDGGGGGSDGGGVTGDAGACIPEMTCGSMCCSGTERCIEGASDFCGEVITCGATATKVTCCGAPDGTAPKCVSNGGVGTCTAGTPCECTGTGGTCTPIGT